MSFEWRYSAVTPDITEHKIKLTLQNSIFHIPFNRKPFAGTYIFECDVFTVEKKVVDISFSFFPLRIGGNFIFEWELPLVVAARPVSFSTCAEYSVSVG